MTILCLGDVFGEEGIEAVKLFVSENRFKYDLIVVNGENASAGFGITSQIADTLFSSGVDVITSGNHIWNKRDIYRYLDSNSRLLRPHNYPDNVPGRGFITLKARNGEDVTVLNLQGSVFMQPLESIFTSFDRVYSSLKGTIIVDLHAEATSEKMAFGHYVTNRASLVFGTHTHVQTNDARILGEFTGYCTDIGMSGSHSGVIGVKREIIISKFLTSLPHRFEPSSGELYIHGVEAKIIDGRCSQISLVKERVS